MKKTVYDITPENAFEPEYRRLYLGGTDIAAILCLSDYKTPFEVWLEKTGQVVPEPEEENDLLIFGHLLEPVIANEWIRRNPQWEIVTENEFTVDPEYSFLCSNTDRRIRNKVTGEIAILECKTVASSAYKHWKLGVPLNYYTQGQHYLSVGGYDRVIFALFVMDSRELKTLEVVRDDLYIEEIRTLAVTFWNDNVVANVSPDKTAFDWSKIQAEDVTIVATDNIVTLVNNLKEAKAILKQNEDRVKGFEDELKLFLQDKTTVVSPDDNKLRLATWNGSNVTRAVSGKIILEKHPDLYEELTNTKYERKLLIK